MWVFTPQEKRAIIFLVVILLVGVGVLSYKKYNPDFAPEILANDFQSTKYKNASSTVSISPADSAAITKNQDLAPQVSKFNLNTASLEDLEMLPRIGPVLAKRIVDYRSHKGGFGTIEEIMKVKGIGKKTFALIKDYLTLE